MKPVDRGTLRSRAQDTPLELPRQVLHERHYSAVLCGDGRLLPIEERLGRRLLRTVDPVSVEGRRLLTGGWVNLRTLDGRGIERVPVARVYDALRRQVEERLFENIDSAPWRRHYRAIIDSIERWRQALGLRPQDH